MEFLDKSILNHREEMFGLQRIKTQLQRKDGTIKMLKEYSSHFQNNIVQNIMDKEFKNFVTDALKFNFDHTGCMTLDDVYDEYNSWYSKKLFGENESKTKEEIEDLCDLIFKPTMFGREEPYYKGYYHVHRKHYLAGSYEDELSGI